MVVVAAAAVVVVGAAVVVVVVVVVAGGGALVVVVVVAGLVVVVVGAAVVVVVVVSGGAVVVTGATRGEAAGCTSEASAISISGFSRAAKPAATTRADNASGRVAVGALVSVGLSAETAANPSAAIRITTMDPAAEI